MIGFARSLVQVVRGGRSRKLLRTYAALAREPRAKLLALQMERVRALCRLACANTVYYREVFKSLGMSPEDIRGPEDFARLPLLTKAIIRERLDDMLSTAMPVKARIENFSGGSTGTPLRFFQDQALYDSMKANMMLCMGFAGWRPSDMVVNIWGNPRDTGDGVPRIGLKRLLSGSVTFNAYRYGRKEIDEWLRGIRGLGRVLVYGYVSALTDVAEHVLRTGVRLRNVRAVMTSAEKLHDHQRDVIGRAFNCRVHDQYGSREVPGIASECECGGMHLLTHSAYVEFLPDPAIDANRLVVTCLTNETMPFLRYEIGDYATPLSGSCACGRGFPLMQMDIGRVVDCLVTPSGQRMYGTFFVRRMYGLDGVESFQFRQREASRIELFVVRGPAFDENARVRVEDVRQGVERDLPGVTLWVEYVNEIPKTQGGKHRHVVCEVAS